MSTSENVCIQPIIITVGNDSKNIIQSEADRVSTFEQMEDITKSTRFHRYYDILTEVSKSGHILFIHGENNTQEVRRYIIESLAPTACVVPRPIIFFIFPFSDPQSSESLTSEELIQYRAYAVPVNIKFDVQSQLGAIRHRIVEVMYKHDMYSKLLTEQKQEERMKKQLLSKEPLRKKPAFSGRKLKEKQLHQIYQQQMQLANDQKKDQKTKEEKPWQNQELMEIAEAVEQTEENQDGLTEYEMERKKMAQEPTERPKHGVNGCVYKRPLSCAVDTGVKQHQHGYITKLARTQALTHEMKIGDLLKKIDSDQHYTVGLDSSTFCQAQEKDLKTCKAQQVVKRSPKEKHKFSIVQAKHAGDEQIGEYAKRILGSTNGQLSFVRHVLKLFQGLHTLHYKGVFHMDLNQHNILYDEKKGLRMIDFGNAISVDEKTEKNSIFHILSRTHTSHYPIDGLIPMYMTKHKVKTEKDERNVVVDYLKWAHNNSKLTLDLVDPELSLQVSDYFKHKKLTEGVKNYIGLLHESMNRWRDKNEHIKSILSSIDVYQLTSSLLKRWREHANPNTKLFSPVETILIKGSHSDFNKRSKVETVVLQLTLALKQFQE